MGEQPTNPFAELSKLCEAAILDVYAADAQPKVRPTGNYASKAGHACRFFLYTLRVLYEELPSPTPELLGIFKTGREIEDSVVSDLRQAGFRVTYQQVAFEDKDLQLRGRIDGFLSHPKIREMLESRGHKLPVNWAGIPMEIKGLHPSYFDSCTDLRTMLKSNKSWVRGYPGQLLLYAYMSKEQNQPLVVMVLRDKASRKTRFLFGWVDEFMDELVRIGENLAAVNEAVSLGTPPEPIQYDSTWCDRCDAAALCPMMMKLKGEGKVTINDSEELNDLLTTIAETQGSATVHDSAEARLKKLLETTGHWPDKVGASEVVIAGDCVATVVVKRGPRRSLSVKRLGEAGLAGLETTEGDGDA